MLLKMRVIYEGQEMEYDMPVGAGRMTIKWLGLTAAQRFSATILPRGFRRHREKAGPVKIMSTSAKLLPCRVYTTQSTFLHPAKSIGKELRDGEEVFVVLASKMPVNQIGRPIRDRWMFIAFNVSEQNAPQREAAIAGEYRAMEEARERLLQEAGARAAELAAKKGAQMRRVMVSQLYSPEKVDTAFEADWGKLCHPVSPPIEKITEDTEEQSRIKDVMLTHYVTLVEVFKHYASVGSGAATGELDLMEYSVFMHDLRGFSAAKSRDLVEKSFAEAISVCKRDKVRAAGGTMGVMEFMFSAIRLACVRYQVSSSAPTGSSGQTGDSGIASSKIKRASSIHQAVDLFMEGIMVPLAHRKVIGLQIKTALDSDDTLAIYHDNDAALKSVFDKYCPANDKIGSPAILGVLLNIAEFGMILRDAGLMGGNSKEDDELTFKEARQAFAGAQNDLCGGESCTPRPSEDAGSSEEQMTYPEFLEGIARVAMLKWEDASLDPKEKIGRAIAAVASLVGIASTA